jgi:cytochrome P450
MTSISANTITAPLPPKVAGLPLVGNTFKMLHDPLAYLVEQYHQLGPIFRIRMGLQDYTVLAGIEANQLLASAEAERLFGSERLFGNFANEVNARDTFLTALDGAPQRHMRKVLQRGYSRSSAAPHVEGMVNIVDRVTGTWQTGQMIPVLDVVRQIVVQQLGLVSTGMEPGEYFEDVKFFLHTMMNVYVVKLLPRLYLRHPRFLKAKARTMELGRKVLEWHRQNPPEATGRTPDIIDDALAGTRPDGKPFTEDDIANIAIGPYFAGIDTISSSISFFIYALCKYPDLMARVTAEVDDFFKDGIPSLNDFRKMDTLHSTAIEVLRVYPVAPFTPRTAMETFEFQGYRVDEGTEVMLAQTVTHFLPQYFENPTRFDIDRYANNWKPATQSFAPYTLGAHTCLGAGLAEAQMMIVMAALVRRVKLELETPNYEVNIRTLPLPNPGRDFKVRVLEKR